MDSNSKPLARCRVLYLGSAPVTDDAIGFDSLQQPLSDRYKQGVNVEGVDSRILVYNTGIQVQFVEEAPTNHVIWFPTVSLYVCAATKCVTYINGTSGLDARKFLPLDVISPDLHGCSPPIFGFITRSINSSSVSLTCHVFVCKTDQASLMLVQCCTTAYENRDVSKDEQNLSSGSVEVPHGPFYLANSHTLIRVYNIETPDALKQYAGRASGPEVGVPWNASQSSVGGTFQAGRKNGPAGAVMVSSGGKKKSTTPKSSKQKAKPNDLSMINQTVDRKSIKREQQRAQSPPPDYDSPRSMKTSTSMADCTICNPPLAPDTYDDILQCSICNPRLNGPRKSITNGGRIIPNPQVSPARQISDITQRSGPVTPPPDYDMDQFDEYWHEDTSQFPKLSDVVRRRADSAMDESVKDQVMLREHRGRRRDHLGDVNQNGNQRAFGRSIGDEIRSKSMVIGHAKQESSPHGKNGRRGFFDNLDETLGYYP